MALLGAVMRQLTHMSFATVRLSDQQININLKINIYLISSVFLVTTYDK